MPLHFRVHFSLLCCALLVVWSDGAKEVSEANLVFPGDQIDPGTLVGANDVDGDSPQEGAETTETSVNEVVQARRNAAEEAKPAAWITPWKPVDPKSCLPQLYLIGASRGGKHAWYWYIRLGYHPRLAVLKSEQANYFALNYNSSDWSLERYLRLFPGLCNDDKPLQGVCSTSKSGTLTLVRADAGMVLRHPSVPTRIKSALPDLRFVVLLRHPVHRAISFFNFRWQIEKLGKLCSSAEDCQDIVSRPSFEELKKGYVADFTKMVNAHGQLLYDCYSKEKTTILDCVPEAKEGSAAAIHQVLEKYAFLNDGIYVKQLPAWFENFPPHNFLFWLSSEFKKSPHAHMKQLVKWVGLEVEEANKDMELSSDIASAMYITSLPSEIMENLLQFYEPYNKQLVELLRAKGFNEVAEKVENEFFHL